MSHSLRRLARLLPVALLSLTVSTPSAVAQVAPQLRPVASPSLDGVSSEVRRSILDAQRRVDGLRSTPSMALAEAYGELGKLYLHFGFYQEAEAAFDNAARLDAAPAGSSPWSYFLAVSHEEQGDLPAAAATLRQVLSAREGNLPAVIRLARVAAELGRAEEARFLFEAATQSPLGKAAGHAGLGRLELDAQRPAQAVEHFEAALEAQPEATALRFRLGMAYRDLGRMDEARELLAEQDGQEVQFPDPQMIQLRLQMQGSGSPTVAGGLAARQGELEKAAQSYRKALVDNPDDLQARRSLAASLFEMRDYEGAGKEYREILQRDPDNASAHMELGSVAIALTDDAAAGVVHLERAVELAPDFREARSRLARALAASGRLPDSIPHLQKAVELDPRDAEGRLQLSRALMETRQVDEASRQIATLLAQEPDNLEGILQSGRIHAAKGNPDAAEREFMRLAELSSAGIGLRSRALFNMALLRQAQSRIAEATEFYAKSLQLDSQHPQALFNLAVIMASNGKLEQAADLYGRLLRLNPGQSDIRYRLAVTQMALDQKAEALGHFEQLLQENPKHIDVIVSSSVLLAEMGRGDEAADRLLAAIAKTPDKGPQARLKSALGAVEVKNGKMERGLGYMRDAVALAAKHPEVRKRYADALAGEKRYAQAADQYAEYVKLAPQDSRGAFAFATALVLDKQWQRAVDELTRITRESSDLAVTHMLARLLASAPEASVRQGDRAVDIAQAVFNAARNPVHGETLAMAMAAAGRFEEAVTLQERLLQEAEDAAFDEGFIDRVRRNLERFQAGQVGVSDW